MGPCINTARATVILCTMILAHESVPENLVETASAVRSTCEEFLNDSNSIFKMSAAEVAFEELEGTAYVKQLHDPTGELKRALEAAWELRDRANGDFAVLQDYGDHYKWLSSIFRCRCCFGYAAFNNINEHTGDPMDWWTVVDTAAQEFSERSDDAPLPDMEMVTEVRDAAGSLGVGLHLILHQMQKYCLNPGYRGAPKHCVRNCDWEGLARHVLYMKERVQREIREGGDKERHWTVFADIVHGVEIKWFETLYDGDDGTPQYTLSTAAKERHQSCAMDGMMLLSTSEHLYDFGILGRI